jgi:hypothetical protein
MFLRGSGDRPERRLTDGFHLFDYVLGFDGGLADPGQD